jgi:hypothetical protein
MDTFLFVFVPGAVTAVLMEAINLYGGPWLQHVWFLWHGFS